MRGTEVKAAGELAGEALSGAGGIVLRDARAASPGGPFGMLGGVAAPVEVIHDGIIGVVYTSVRAGCEPSRAAARALAQTGPDPAPVALHARTGRSRSARSTACGAIGSSATTPRSRSGWSSATAAARPTASRSSSTGCARRHVMAPGRPPDLRRAAARGPRSHARYARYNTGRHISDNGRALAAALDALVAGWPVEVSEIVLVGHSMGGLVARSACHYGECDGLGWTEQLRHVVCLGSPHMGAPLERGAAHGSHLLSRLPETAPLARC